MRTKVAEAIVDTVLDWDYQQETSGHADTSFAVHEMVMLSSTKRAGNGFRFVASKGNSFDYEYGSRVRSTKVNFEHGASFVMRGDTLFACRKALRTYLGIPCNISIKKLPLRSIAYLLDDERRPKLEAVQDLLPLDSEGCIVSDHTLSSFILFPHDDKLGSINRQRSSYSYLLDNPFAFFRLLRKVFKSQGNADSQHEPLAKLLCHYWDFFSEFGDGSQGFKKYVETFCLNPFVYPYSSQEHYPSQFMDVDLEQFKDPEFFRKYLNAIRCACANRRNLLAKRMKDPDRFSRMNALL